MSENQTPENQTPENVPLEKETPENVPLEKETPEDVPLRRETSGGATPEETTSGKLGTPLLIGVVLVLLVAASLFLYYRYGRAPAPPAPAPPTPPAEAPTPEPTPAEPELELPELDRSDRLIRAVVGELSEHPELVAWLTPDDLVRRFVAAVDDVSRGKSPRPHLGHLAPERGFRATETGGELRIDPRSYDRYDPFVEVFLSLDTADGARLYRRLDPLFQEAYRDLGYPEGDFDRALARAFDEVLATPIPEGPVELERGVDDYLYADPELEALDPAQKHFLRLGPENMRQAQAKLRLLRAALELPEG